MTKTILSTALAALILSSGAAFACSHHACHHIAQNHDAYLSNGYSEGYYGYGPYRHAPEVMGAYHDPYGTYDVEPSPVTDQ